MVVDGFPGLIDEGVPYQKDSAEGDGNIGNIENGPAQTADSTVDEIDYFLFRKPVDQIARGAARYQSKRHMLPSLRWR